MNLYNYKKSQIQQMKAFCFVMEYKSYAETAKKLCTSVASVSRQVSALEQHLGVKFFKRGQQSKLIPTQEALEFYNKAKVLLKEFDALYKGTLNVQVSTFDATRFRIKKKLEEYNKAVVKELKKMVIRITFKRLVLILLTFIVGLNVYLCETNYWFDKKLEKMASPLLKEIMKVGDYRIGKDKVCTFESMQSSLDFSTLVSKLDKKTPITFIKTAGCPSTALRINDNVDVQEVFHNSKEIKCDIERRFQAMITQYKLVKDHLTNHDNVQIHQFHKTTDCTNYNVFLDNVKKYPNQIFSHLVDKEFETSSGLLAMFKKGSYYYCLFIMNSSQPHFRDKPKEVHLIFKKLTLNQLMHYDNGSYWRLIKDYNIKID